jgi:hypothetical protein
MVNNSFIHGKTLSQRLNSVAAPAFRTCTHAPHFPLASHARHTARAIDAPAAGQEFVPKPAAATTPALLRVWLPGCRPGGQVIFAALDSAAVSGSDDIRARCFDDIQADDDGGGI